MAITLTITSDGSASFDDTVLGRAGELAVALTVVVPSEAHASTDNAYLDFMLPDGTIVYKGVYDASSGTFNATLGSSDMIMSQAGEVYVQLVMRDAATELATVIWKSERAKIEVSPSINATVPATIAIVPPLTMPATYPAETVTIADAGSLITATNVEDALQEMATPANLLTAIKTVDGAASGLDSDLLDTYEAAAFIRKAEVISYGVSRNAAQTFSSGTTDLTVQLDTISWGSPTLSGYGIVVPTGNFWAMVTGLVVWDSNATGIRNATLLKNSAATARSRESAYAFAHQLNVAGVIPVTTGDVLYLAAWQNSGGNLDIISGGYSKLNCILIPY